MAEGGRAGPTGGGVLRKVGRAGLAAARHAAAPDAVGRWDGRRGGQSALRERRFRVKARVAAGGMGGNAGLMAVWPDPEIGEGERAWSCLPPFR